jgi:hypothetical protein
VGVNVIQNYLRELGSLGSHWVVVIVVGLSFLLLQLALSLRIYLGARRQERTLARLRRDLDRGGDGRSEIDGLPESFGWLHWVNAVFPAGGAGRGMNFKRDDALHELDTRLASDPSYLLLQRMGIMAPLLGVVLTVIGFYWLKVDDAAEQSLGSILLAVTPLVSGVGAGAILALVNQGLLHAVGGRIDRVRMSARTWFDAAVWRHVSIESQSASANAVAAVDRFSRTVAESAERHAASFGRIDESTVSLRRAAAQFQDVVSSFHGEIKGVPQALNVLQEAMAASARALQDLIPMGARAIANLDVSVAAFRSTVDQEFKDAAKQHYRSSKSLAQTVEQVGESSDSLKVGADEMKRSLELLTSAAAQLESAGTRLQRSVEKDVAPSQGSMHDAVASFERSATQLTEFVEQGVGPATERLANLEQTLAGMDEAVQSIKRFSQTRGDIDRLAETLARSAEIAEALAALPEQLRAVMEENAARQAELVNPRGRTWLGTRPR